MPKPLRLTTFFPGRKVHQKGPPGCCDAPQLSAAGRGENGHLSRVLCALAEALKREHLLSVQYTSVNKLPTECVPYVLASERVGHEVFSLRPLRQVLPVCLAWLISLAIQEGVQLTYVEKWCEDREGAPAHTGGGSACSS